MVSTAMARKNGLKVGSTFPAYGKTLTVAAIFESDSQQGNDTVITSLPVLQRLERDTGWPALLRRRYRRLADRSRVGNQSDRAYVLGPRASVVSYLADAHRAVDDLDSVKGIALDSLVGAVGAAVVILFLVMVLIVRERKREIGTLKAIGAPERPDHGAVHDRGGDLHAARLGRRLRRRRSSPASPVTSSLVSHSGVSSDTGARGLFGAGSPVLTRLTDINARVGWPVILEGLAAAVVVAVLASAAAAWMIGRIRPAEVLRSE